MTDVPDGWTLCRWHSSVVWSRGYWVAAVLGTTELPWFVNVVRTDTVTQARRTQHRQQIIPAANNPEEFSSLQLQNFLKSSTLTVQVLAAAAAVDLVKMCA